MKGQVTIIAIVMTVFTLVLFAGFFPLIQALINQMFPSLDNMSQTIVSLIIPMMLIGIIISFWAYVAPQRQVPPQY